MAIDFEDCEFNTLTADLSDNTHILIKIIIDDSDIQPLIINLGNWRDLMKAFTLLPMTLQYLKNHSTDLWEDLRRNRNLDELIGQIKGVV